MIASFTAGGTFASFVVVVVWLWWRRWVIVTVAWKGFVPMDVDASFSQLAFTCLPPSAFFWMPKVAVIPMVARSFFVGSA